jgi:hypothetical protein
MALELRVLALSSITYSKQGEIPLDQVFPRSNLCAENGLSPSRNSEAGIYTMENFVATEPEAVLAGTSRTLKPGGRLSLFEYDHELDETSKM